MGNLRKVELRRRRRKLGKLEEEKKRNLICMDEKRSMRRKREDNKQELLKMHDLLEFHKCLIKQVNSLMFYDHIGQKTTAVTTHARIVDTSNQRR